MEYVVKRGYTYVNPKTAALTQAGGMVDGATVDETQKWKLQVGELAQAPGDGLPIRKKSQSFEEATAALVKKRNIVTAARVKARNDAQQKEVKAAKADADTVPSDVVKAKQPVQAEDYKFDEMDEGEET
jgi:hypothetical protein